MLCICNYLKCRRHITECREHPTLNTLPTSDDTYTSTPIVINCEEFNSAVLLDIPDAIVYRLAQESPLLYAELACKPNGLQEYVDDINWFNPS